MREKYIRALEKENRRLEMEALAVPPKRTRRDLAPEDRAEIVKMRNSGLQLRDIAKRMNRPYGTIRMVLAQIRKKAVN